LDGGGGEEFEADNQFGAISVHPNHFGFEHLAAGGEGGGGMWGADVEGQYVAGDEGGGKGEGEAEAGGADVGRLAGEVAGGLGFVDFDGAGLFDAEAAAALVRWGGGAGSIE